VTRSHSVPDLKKLNVAANFGGRPLVPISEEESNEAVAAENTNLANRVHHRNDFSTDQGEVENGFILIQKQEHEDLRTLTEVEVGRKEQNSDVENHDQSEEIDSDVTIDNASCPIVVGESVDIVDDSNDLKTMQTDIVASDPVLNSEVETEANRLSNLSIGRSGAT
jgi:hypothetical protein